MIKKPSRVWSTQAPRPVEAKEREGREYGYEGGKDVQLRCFGDGNALSGGGESAKVSVGTVFDKVKTKKVDSALRGHAPAHRAVTTGPSEACCSCVASNKSSRRTRCCRRGVPTVVILGDAASHEATVTNQMVQNYNSIKDCKAARPQTDPG